MCSPFVADAGAAPRTLDIYFIDVEGGQATLVVTPAGQALLVDTGYAGFDDRDATRILAATRDAGVHALDYLLLTHFHRDHGGGAVGVARGIPIRTFVDHDQLESASAAATEDRFPGTLEMYNNYARVRAKGTHLQPKPGDRLPLRGVEVTVISAAGETITKPLRDAGQPNASCGGTTPSPDDPFENPRSTGVLLRYGRFSFLDLGDLTGAPLQALVCPKSLIGSVDLALVPHHGGADGTYPAVFDAWRARVAIVNNGATKGGSVEVFDNLRRAPGLEGAWQLHRSALEGVVNLSEGQIANLDETTGHWVKVSASRDGSFAVTNGRTGVTKRFSATRKP